MVLVRGLDDIETGLHKTHPWLFIMMKKNHYAQRQCILKYQWVGGNSSERHVAFMFYL